MKIRLSWSKVLMIRECSLVGLHGPVTLARHQGVAPREASVFGNHLRDQLIEASRRRPTELTPRFGCIAEERFDLRGSEVTRVDANDGVSAPAVHAHLLDSLSAPLEAHSQVSGDLLGELADGMLNAGRDHEVLRRLLLQHSPLRLHVVARMAPI